MLSPGRATRATGGCYADSNPTDAHSWYLECSNDDDELWSCSYCRATSLRTFVDPPPDSAERPSGGLGAAPPIDRRGPLPDEPDVDVKGVLLHAARAAGFRGATMFGAGSFAAEKLRTASPFWLLNVAYAIVNLAPHRGPLLGKLIVEVAAGATPLEIADKLIDAGTNGRPA